MANCRWLQADNGEIIGALTQSGERSKLFDDLQKQFSKEDSIMYYAVSQSDNFQEIFTEEPTIENLLRYVANQNKTEEKLTKEQLVDLQDFSNFDRERLFNTFYDRNGLFLVSEDKLTKSGLYSAYEAGTIANDVELQDKIKDVLERLKNTSDEELQLVEPGQVTKLNEFNSFGKLVTTSEVGDLIPFSRNKLDLLKKEIEENYAKTNLDIFNGQSDDIRMKAFNYDSPIAQRTLNGVDLRIAEGLIRDKKKTYLLYMNGEIVGEFPSVQSIKDIIKDIEDRLLPNIIENQKQAEVFVEVGEEIRPKRNTETELILPITAKQTENSKVSDLNSISLEVLQNNEEETRQVLDEIENELIKDSIDVIGLTEKPIDENLKDFISVLDRFIKDPTTENTKDFADKSDEYFNRDLSPKKENIDGEQTKEYVKLETTLSEEEVYNQQGLIKLDDNTYIKTTKENLTTLYENLRTYTEKYSKNKTLEEHVQEQLKDYNYTNAETAEAIILYKMYFSNTPNNTFVDKNGEKVIFEIYDGINGKVDSFEERQNKDRLSFIIRNDNNESIGNISFWKDIDGKFYSNNTNIVENYRRRGIATAVYDYATYLGIDIKPSITQTKMGESFFNTREVRKINKNYQPISIIEEESFDFRTGESTVILKNNLKQVSNFTGNYSYLTEEFPSDFYSKFLAEKKKNSKLFRNFYSNFEINEKGINLINKSEIALRNIKIYADENLQQYSLISRQMIDLTDPTDNISNPRVEAVNNPQKIKESKENLYKLNDQEIIIKNETEDFVKIGNDIYESVAKQGNLNHFVKLETPTSDYYAVEVKAPQTNLKLSDYNYLNESPEKFKTIKNFLKGENPDELQC